MHNISKMCICVYVYCLYSLYSLFTFESYNFKEFLCGLKMLVYSIGLGRLYVINYTKKIILISTSFCGDNTVYKKKCSLTMILTKIW